MKAVFLLLVLLTSQPTSLPVRQSAGEEEMQQAVRLAIAKRYDEALAVLHRLLAGDPESAEINYLIGLCYFHSEDLERSVRYFEASVSHRPQFPNPYLWLARAYLLQEESEKARQVLSQGLKRFPRHQPLLDLSTGAQPQ